MARRTNSSATCAPRPAITRRRSAGRTGRRQGPARRAAEMRLASSRAGRERGRRPSVASHMVTPRYCIHPSRHWPAQAAATRACSARRGDPGVAQAVTQPADRGFPGLRRRRCTRQRKVLDQRIRRFYIVRLAQRVERQARPAAGTMPRTGPTAAGSIGARAHGPARIPFRAAAGWSCLCRAFSQVT